MSKKKMNAERTTLLKQLDRLKKYDSNIFSKVLKAVTANTEHRSHIVSGIKQHMMPSVEEFQFVDFDKKHVNQTISDIFSSSLGCNPDGLEQLKDNEPHCSKPPCWTPLHIWKCEEDKEEKEEEPIPTNKYSVLRNGELYLILPAEYFEIKENGDARFYKGDELMHIVKEADFDSILMEERS